MLKYNLQKVENVQRYKIKTEKKGSILVVDIYLENQSGRILSVF